MKRLTIQVGLLPAIILVLFGTACTKIEQTTLGGDLIPVIDNITTFDTVIQVISNNYIPEDSTRITAGADHMVGGISNDPLFGSSKSTLYFQMMPLFFPFKFNFLDSTPVFFDSAVLVLRYRGYYGDIADPVVFNLFETNEIILPDTSIQPTYTINPNYAPFLSINRSKVWGQKTRRANQYGDSIAIKRGDTTYRIVTNELRIPLNEVLARGLFFGDANTVYGSDTVFKRTLPGFALEAQGLPNALHYFNLGQGSQIQFFYRATISGKQDTLESSFGLTARSGHAVHFERTRNGAEIGSFLTQNDVTGVPQIYIQSTPGSMASIKIPGIENLSNRIIHRAELRAVEISSNSPATAYLQTPTGLYLDAEDKQKPGNFRGIPYDLNASSRYFCFPSAGIDFSYYGGFATRKRINGDSLNSYTFNITRYLQSVITRNEPSFNFRLSAPYYMEYNECISNNSAFPPTVFPFQTGNTFIVPPGDGRIRLAGGNHPDPQLRMQLRMVYSIIQ